MPATRDNEKRHDVCFMTEEIHDIDKRTAILEREIPFIVENINKTCEKFDGLNDKVDGISTYIAKQNGVLPRLESAMFSVLDHLSVQDKAVAVAATKSELVTKLVWSIGGTVVGGSLAYIATKWILPLIGG